MNPDELSKLEFESLESLAELADTKKNGKLHHEKDRTILKLIAEIRSLERTLTMARNIGLQALRDLDEKERIINKYQKSWGVPIRDRVDWRVNETFEKNL